MVHLGFDVEVGMSLIFSFVTYKNFALHFKPDPNCGQLSLNVLPDFFKPGTLKVTRINVNGADRSSVDPDNYRIELDRSELGSEVVVEFEPRKLR